MSTNSCPLVRRPMSIRFAQWFKSIVSIALFFLSAVVGAESSKLVDFHSQVQPLLNNRCASCHSCYQAPCQLKLNSWEGITRGLTKEHKVYNPTRLSSGLPTRLFQDANTTRQWRKFDFFPVLPEYDGRNRKSADPSQSLIMELVAQRAAYGSNEGLGKSEESRTCSTNIKKLRKHLKKNQNAGMPFGLPALSRDELNLMSDWTEQGSKGPSQAADAKRWAPSSEAVAQKIQSWENFLNKEGADRNRSRLVSRYLFEHLFMANLSFDPKSRDFYRLVRSRNGCNVANGGRLIDEVKSRMPYGNPIAIGEFSKEMGKRRTKRIAQKDREYEKFRWDKIMNNGTEEYVVRATDIYTMKGDKKPYGPTAARWIEASYNKFKYCFKKVPHVIPTKSHMLVQLTDEKKSRYEDLFFKTDWKVRSLPGFMDEIGDSSDFANPFIVFEDIPAESRYRFLLEEAEYTIRTFIRGPVCRGGTAVNSIDEQFFVLFLDPKSDQFVVDKDYARSTYDSLRTPPHYGSDIHGRVIKEFGLGNFFKFWERLKDEREVYRKKRARQYVKARRFPTKDNPTPIGGFTVKDLWRGDSVAANPNAILTVMRHYDSASVNSGALGPMSKTGFVLDYPLLERFVYTLATGYDVLGDMGHQILSRIYMSFLRTEGEMNLLQFLPNEKGYRKKLRQSWYRDKETAISLIEELNCKYKRGKTPIDKCHPLRSESYLKAQVPYSFANPSDALANFGFEAKKQFFKQAFEYLGASAANGLVDLPVARQLGMDTSSVNDPEKEILLGLGQLPRGKSADSEGFFVSYMPNLTYILVRDPLNPENNKVYSIIRNKAHYNIMLVNAEDARREVERDEVMIIDGFVGMYPNMFFQVDKQDLRSLVGDLKNVKFPADYDTFIETYGVAQTNPNFWNYYDEIMAVSIPKSPESRQGRVPDQRQFLQGGIVDLNRYGISYDNDSAPDEIGEKIYGN